MGHELVLDIARQGLLIVVVLSLPVMLTAAVVGLAVAMVQAITSLQEQTVSQTLKLLAVSGLLFFIAPWAASTLLQFAQQALAAAAR